MVIYLGARAGTKAKRPEADLLRPADWLAWQLVLWLCTGLEQAALLVGGYTYGLRGTVEEIAARLDEIAGANVTPARS